MDTPIVDFVKKYCESGTVRLHMPGHKGRGELGVEGLDITEIHGADALYEASGIIKQSEANATALFGTQRTLYSTEGSSQCIRAMLYLAVQGYSGKGKPVILAARNVHKSFIYASALLDIKVSWLYSTDSTSICSCIITPEALEKKLSSMKTMPAAVYVTSPDYLGGMSDIRALAEVCHRHHVYLLVDNAHGAYTHFLKKSLHPMDLGADMCCDSAHKTLPVLTGGAYLHIGKKAPETFAANAKSAMALFGSTSPSYLILQSLDLCNKAIADADTPHVTTESCEENALHVDSESCTTASSCVATESCTTASSCVATESYTKKLADLIQRIDVVKKELKTAGYEVMTSDPLKLVLWVKNGIKLSEALSKSDASEKDHPANIAIECEYADDDYIVFMFTPSNTEADIRCLSEALLKYWDEMILSEQEKAFFYTRTGLMTVKNRQAVSIRKAFFAPHETVPVEKAAGRICASPLVACPPAIPIVISGERISEKSIALFHKYHITEVDVIVEK